MKLRKCRMCGKYTLKEICVKCGLYTTSPASARFSPEDRYGSYRRKMKREMENVNKKECS